MKIKLSVALILCFNIHVAHSQSVQEIADASKELQFTTAKGLNFTSQKPAEIDFDISSKSVVVESDVRAFVRKLEGAATQRIAEFDAVINKLTQSRLLFASFSLKEKGLMDVFETASLDQDIRIVFQGVPEDMKVMEGIALIHKLVRQFDPIPNVVINPTLFTKYGIVSAPTLMQLDSDEEPIAWVAGMQNVEWLHRQIELGRTGDLGVFGNAIEVTEPNLIDVMKRRAAAIDWKEKQQATKDNFWKGQTFYRLHSAQRDSRRILNPTIRVAKDIVSANGVVVAKKGTIINQLEVIPFTQAMIIFNAGNQQERVRISHEIARLRALGYQRITLMTTTIDKDKGWKDYEELTNFLDSHIFLLTDEIRQRFAVRATPTVITADNIAKRFIIDEFYVNPVLADEEVDDEAAE